MRRFLVGRPRVAAAASLVTVTAVLGMGASVLRNDPGALAPQACPPQMKVAVTADLARKLRPGLDDAEVASIVAQLGERVCVTEKLPKSAAAKELGRASRPNARGLVPDGALLQAVAQRDAMVAAGLQATVPGAAGTWEKYGAGPLMANDPEYVHTYGIGWGGLSGRVDSLDYDPVGNRLFATVGTGGVWVSENLGESWRSIGDNLPTQIVGGVAWTPAGNGTVVIGAGEPLVGGGNVYVADGAYWSADLGATWNKATGVPNGIMTMKIAVDRANPARVYLATTKGLFRSTDAGRSYVNVNLPTSPECAGVTGEGTACQFANIVSDVIVKAPGGFANDAGGQVLAAVGFYRGTRKYVDGKPFAPNRGLYRSEDGAPGTFTYLEDIYVKTTTPTELGLDDNVSPLGFAEANRIGRVELGAATGPAQDHNYVYAIVQDAVLMAGGAPVIDIEQERGANSLATATVSVINGIYVSPDFGSSWIRMADYNEIANNPNTGSTLIQLRPLIAAGAQAWYNLWIKPDPTRADPATGAPTRLLFGLEEIWANRATHVPLNGLLQQGPDDFHVVGRYENTVSCLLALSGTDGAHCPPTREAPIVGTTTHPDQHDGLWVETPDGVCIFAGNDGGVYKQCVADAVGEITNLGWGDGANEGFNTLLPYAVAAAKDGTVWWGLQDNGSGKTEFTPEHPLGRHVMAYGGDGFFAAVDPNNSDVAYSETTNGTMKVTLDGGRTWWGMSPGLLNAPFSTPFMMDPTDPNHLIAGGRDIAETTLGPDTCVRSVESNALSNCDWVKVFDLGLSPNDSTAPRQTTALDVHGDSAYVGFCGRCSIAAAAPQKGFLNGIATNVGGEAPPQRGTSSGWHIAAAAGLPARYITGVEIDRDDPRTVYVTVGGYYANAQWSPPGQYLDGTQQPAPGTGHVFKSTDAGETFVDISGNLPNVHTTSVALRCNQLVVGTDIGSFISSDVNGTTWAPLGTGLPNVIVNDLELSPATTERLYASTFGRGIYAYKFPEGTEECPVTESVASGFIVTAPVQGDPSGVEAPAAAPACGTDSDGAYAVTFSYTKPENGNTPSGFRIEEATQVTQAFFDAADAQLAPAAPDGTTPQASNATWAARGAWISSVNPQTRSLAYYVPNTANQQDTLTLKAPIALPAGGATLTFDTTLSTEPGFDFFIAEASTDGGASWQPVGSWSGVVTDAQSADLSKFAGNAVTLRFRQTSDSNTGLAGTWIENIRVVTNDFTPVAQAAANATSFAFTGKGAGTRHYRVAALFAQPSGTVAGPVSNARCVTSTFVNRAPVANAGADFAVDEGATALLSAAGSSDPDAGDVLSYQWTQTAGPGVVLSDDTSATPSFVAPAVSADTPVTFELTVTDDGSLSSTDSVTVTVRNAAGDTTVDPFTFVHRTGVATSTFITSETKTLTGFDEPLAISVSANGQYRINGGAWVTAAGTVVAGDTLAVRHVSSGAAGATVETLVTVGDYATAFKSTTTSVDRTPDAFGFQTQNGVPRGALIESNVITPTGFNAAVSVTVSAGAEYRINGGAWTSTAGTLNQGETLQTRHTSAAGAASYTKTSVKLGTVTGTFTTRTQ